MKYKNLLILLSLFLFQISLIFRGEIWFGKFINPFLLLFVSIALGVYAYRHRGENAVSLSTNKTYSSWWFSILSILAVVASFEEVRKGFLIFPAFEGSDVMIQLDTQYNRFVQGEFPYKPLKDLLWEPFPVYMPMHWLPIGISKFLHIDIRWSSFFIYAVIAGIFGFQTSKHVNSNLYKLIFTLMPAIALWAFVLFGRQDLFITIEILIAGYYLILAAGLIFKNNSLIVLGIIFCLLSRYTFIFWLPLFAIIFLAKNSIKKSVYMASLIIASVILFYIIPFLRIDPSIFSVGIAYHNKCAVGEWNDSFYTSTYGVNFAYLIKSIVGDNNEQGVFINRAIQAIALLLTMFIGLIYYFKSKFKPNYYHYLMLFLYLFVLVFFVFCPLTYRYYLIVLLALSISVMSLPFIESKTIEKL